MPRASEATPWVSRVGAVAPCKGRSFISISNIECFCPFRASILWQSVTQGVASLALGYVHHWAFIDIIGCGSAIQASLIAFALHDDSARPCKIRNFSHLIITIVYLPTVSTSSCGKLRSVNLLVGANSKVGRLRLSTGVSLSGQVSTLRSK